MKAFRAATLVVRDAVEHDLPDGGPVAPDQALEIPLVAQHRREREVVGARRHPVDGVEGGHERPRPLIHGGVERREVDVPERALGDLR
jgi:hypothetical protein